MSQEDIMINQLVLTSRELVFISNRLKRNSWHLFRHCVRCFACVPELL